MHQPRNLSIDSEHHYFWHVITLPTTIHFFKPVAYQSIANKIFKETAPELHSSHK